MVVDQRLGLPVLYGRDEECATIQRLLEGAREGRSQALLVQGAAGVGKSALLDHALVLAPTNGMHTLRACGVESESELAFAGLHQLLRPVLGLLERIPQPQAAALRGAFGLAPAAGADRFLVAAGVLSLLAEAAEEAPLVCVVDDVHWVDQPSVAALGFAARRLEAEGVVVLLAARDDDLPVGAAAGLPSLRLAGLSSDAAAALLAAHAGSKLASWVRDHLVAASDGNPFALLEVVRLLDGDQVAGREPLPDPLPLGVNLQKAYHAQLRNLPEPARAALLVAAADDSGELNVVVRAMGRLGLEQAALGAAEAGGCVQVDQGRVQFRHPLIRAAVYQAATFVQRCTAHRALADVLTGAQDADRRAWHLAAAATEPDERVAVELERSAERARQRSGYAAAVAALDRSAKLTPSRDRRGARMVAGAEAAWLAGQPERGAALLDDAAPLVTTPHGRARLAYLQGVIEVNSGTPERGYRLLVDATSSAAAVEAGLASPMLMEAARFAWLANDPARMREVATGLAAVSEQLGRQPDGPLRFVTGAQRLLAGDPEQAVAALDEAAAAMSTSAQPQQRVMASVVAEAAGDAAAWEMAANAVRDYREQGALGWLPLSLAVLASREAMRGQFSAAAADAAEGLNLAQQTGQEFPVSACQAALAYVAAVQGDHARCTRHAGAALASASARRTTPAAGLAIWAQGLLDLGLGHTEHAFGMLLRLYTADPSIGHPLLGLGATGDLVQAAVHAGWPPEAHEAVPAANARFQRWATATNQPWAQALAARCRALLAGAAAQDEDPEPHFTEALRLHRTGERPFDQARTQLTYGQWLRRARRPGDARAHLRAAQDTFAQLGATPWAARASAELRATGESAHQCNPAALTKLTPQELQIVRIVRDGASNREAAARLLLSPKTIEYHLGKVYTKLGITSRVELARLPLD